MGQAYLSMTTKSKMLYRRAERVLPAGVTYFLRFFKPYPFYTAQAKGSKLYDVDGNDYVDFWMGHYTFILGHSPPEVVREVKRQLDRGSHYGTAHESEIALAEQVAKMVPSAEMVRFTNSGTEANMYAMRLARAVTRRNLIAKFEGGWHGGYDALDVAVKAPYDVSESNGLTDGALRNTIVLPMNRIDRARKAVRKGNVAAVLIEPMLTSAGCIPVEVDFLKELREICSENNTLLVFDEVITGFRLAPGGGQEFFGVKPDITVFGKILGGGFPIGCIAASKDIMEHMNPLMFPRPEFCFQGGTFCGNPISMAAGLATLRLLEDGSRIRRLNQRCEYLRQQLSDIFDCNRQVVQVTGIGSLWHTHFNKDKISNANAAERDDKEKLVKYHMRLIEGGVFYLPGKSGSLSTAHTKDDLQRLLRETEAYCKSV